LESSSGDIPKHLRKGNDVPDVLSLTTGITVAYASNPAHSGGVDQLLTIIREVANTLHVLADEENPPPLSTSSETDGTGDTLTCLDCGMKVKLLKRHLITKHELTPEDYRKAHNLSADAPMVTRGYAEVRSQLAKDSGLGKRKVVEIVQPRAKRVYRKRVK